MGKKIMQEEKIIKAYDSKVDSNRRITLRKGKGLPLYEHYQTLHLEDGTIILKPLVLAHPENVISKETLAALDSSISNFKQKKIGGTFDKTQYDDLFDDKEDE